MRTHKEMFDEMMMDGTGDFISSIRPHGVELHEEAYQKCIDMVLKPTQYQIGIDTFERCKETMSREQMIGFCKGNVDKYIWRNKGCDAQDLVKAKDYIDLWLWALENK